MYDELLEFWQSIFPDGIGYDYSHGNDLICSFFYGKYGTELHSYLFLGQEWGTSHRIEIEEIQVGEALQGQGISKKILSGIIPIFLKWGVNTITLQDISNGFWEYIIPRYNQINWIVVKNYEEHLGDLVIPRIMTTEYLER